MLDGNRVVRFKRLIHIAASVACTAVVITAAPRPTAHAQAATTARSGAGTKAPGRILGVFDAESSAPLEGAEVVDLFVDNVYRTGASGLIGLWALQQRHDSVAIRVRRVGYADTAFAVLVGARDTAPVSVFLRRQTTLPAVITDALANKHLTPNQAEFEGRLHDQSLNGRFLTRADLDKQATKSISHVLTELTAGKSRGCNVPPLVYVDGLRAPMSGADTLIMRAGDYEGIEFYMPGAAPVRFGGTLEATTASAGTMAAPSREAGSVAGAAGPSGSPSSIRASSSCGVILLWRRETP